MMNDSKAEFRQTLLRGSTPAYLNSSRQCTEMTTRVYGAENNSPLHPPLFGAHFKA